MKTGGQAVLSSSFFKDSESIQRKTSTAGETSARTARPKPRRLRARGVHASAAHVTLHPLPRVHSSSAAATMMSAKNTTTTAEA